VGFGTTAARLDVGVLIRHVCIVCVAIEPVGTVFAVYNAIEGESDTGKERMEAWNEVDVFSKCEPELRERRAFSYLLWSGTHILRRLPSLV
jgi:hypothetical protein